jgi:hypothetical protein
MQGPTHRLRRDRPKATKPSPVLEKLGPNKRLRTDLQQAGADLDFAESRVIAMRSNRMVATQA